MRRFGVALSEGVASEPCRLCCPRLHREEGVSKHSSFTGSGSYGSSAQANILTKGRNMPFSTGKSLPQNARRGGSSATESGVAPRGVPGGQQSRGACHRDGSEGRQPCLPQRTCSGPRAGPPRRWRLEAGVPSPRQRRALRQHRPALPLAVCCVCCCRRQVTATATNPPGATRKAHPCCAGQPHPADCPARHSANSHPGATCRE